MPAKKQITREMILETAMKLLRTEGIDAVNVKGLAKAMNCSTQPIYLSFASMDALRQELLPIAVSEFEKLLRNEAIDRDKACLYGAEYIKAAQNEPQLFRFLFMRENSFAQMRESLSRLTEEAIERFMQEYELGYDDAHFLHDQLWMHAHGIASMAATKFCDWDMEKVEKMLEESRTLFEGKCRK